MSNVKFDGVFVAKEGTALIVAAIAVRGEEVHPLRVAAT
jgi:hypothetical protein